MPTAAEIRNCDNLKARADRIRERQVARGMWTLDDEGDWEEIRRNGALDLWDDDAEGYAWNATMNLCAGWTAELDAETSTRSKAVELISLSLAIHGRCTLACSCGARAVAIDSDAVGSDADVARAVELIDHARYGHALPTDVVATITKRIVVLSAVAR